MPEHEPDSRTVQERLPHISALDGLRGVAILSVLVFHLLWSNTQTGHRLLDFLLEFKAAGWVGVDLFFCLSGFLITGILFGSLDDKRYFSNFYARRVLRIFPLYYAVTAGVLIYLLVTHQTGDGNLGRLGLIAVYLQNTPMFLGHTAVNAVAMGVGHFWSLAVEEQFYLVWPVLIFLVRKRERLMLLALGLAAVAPIARTLLLQHGASILYVYSFTFCRQDSLLCGAWLALAVRGPNREKVLRYAWIPFVLAIAAIAVIAAKNGNFDYERTLIVNKIGFTLVAVASTAFIAFCLRAGSLSQRLMDTSLLKFMGRYSYGIYVLHPLVEHSPVGSFSELGFWSRMHSAWISHLVHFFSITGVSVFLAVLSFHFYEKPFLQLKRFFNYERG